MNRAIKEHAHGGAGSEDLQIDMTTGPGPVRMGIRFGCPAVQRLFSQQLAERFIDRYPILRPSLVRVSCQEFLWIGSSGTYVVLGGNLSIATARTTTLGEGRKCK